MLRKPVFSSLNFGYARAETERTENPNLLIEGYYDELNIADQALNGPIFLFLGYKGAGKSALLNHIELDLIEDHNGFSSIYYLEDFSFSNFSKIIRGNSEPQAKYPAAWSWLLLILAFDSLCQDEGLQHTDMTAFQAAVSSLRSMGFMTGASIKFITELSAKKNFKLNIPKIFEAGGEYTKIESLRDIPLFNENAKRLMSKCRSNSKHIIMIDGLDDILTSRKVQFDSLGALIFEVDRLNDFFRNNSVPVKFLVACRVDLYDRIGGANKNKVKQDKARYLDWYKDPKEPKESPLWSMAATKAGVGSAGELLSLLPRALKSGRPIAKAVLEHTRHTPRDMLMLLKKISEASRGEADVTHKHIASGIRQYSLDYFFGEICDELDGYCQKHRPADWLEFIGSFGSSTIEYADLTKAIDKQKLPENEFESVLQALFDCSAIGNVVKSETVNYFSFKYRNRNSRFILENDITIHRGLRKSLNIP